MTQLTLLKKTKLAETSSSFFEDLDLCNFSGWPDLFGQKCQLWASETLKKPIRTLSLFSGAGGLDIGFHDAGFSIQSCIEIEQKYANTLVENSGDHNYFGKDCHVICDDIRNYHSPEDMEIDFIIGGPPCQTFSAAGRRASGVMGTDDARGMLFEEYIRLLKKLQPKGFLFENVYGIIGAQGGSAWKQIQEGFSSAGYRIFHRILDTSDYGVPQFRERLFIVGLRDGEYHFPRPTHGPESLTGIPHFTAGEAILTAPASKDKVAEGLNGRYGHLLNDIPPGLNYSFYTKEMGHPNPIFAWRSKFSDFLYKADPDEPIRTLKAQGGQYTGPFHWDNRPFTLPELKRLQTFPDSYHVTGTRLVAIQQLGNSVPPQLARVLALSILSQVFGMRLPFDLPLLSANETLSFRQRKASKTKIYKEKALKAIANMEKPASPMRFKEKHYNAGITADFELVESGSYSVSVEESKGELVIEVSADLPSNSSFEIAIAPVNGNVWNLCHPKVRLKTNSLAEETFIIAWKAFERELIESGKKADLVQLHGYYQYAPSFKATMMIDGPAQTDPKWTTVARVVSGQWCRLNYSDTQLAAVWEVPQEEVLALGLFLRQIGYEIRNSKTNPQVPEGHYLIPYPFPTLNRMSVQLRKSLV